MMRPHGVKIQKPKSLSKMVAEEIKEAILRGTFQPGDKLVETRLTQSLGVSRTPLREAFHELAAEGYITVVPHKGAYVSQVSEEEVMDIHAIASVLEGLATRLATPPLSRGEGRAELLRLFGDIQRHSESGDVDAYWAANLRFHQLIADSCGNERLRGLIENLRRQLLKTRVVSLRAPGRLEDSMREHEAIVKAILEGRGREAERLVIEHHENQERLLLELIRSREKEQEKEKT